MDPWNSYSGSSVEVSTGFQDTFLESYNAKFEKLPDSEEYLNILENRLKNLEKKKGQKSFRENKEEILGNLIRSESRQLIGILNESDLALDREVQPNLILRQLVPQQPLTVGESVPLVECDQLDKQYSQSLETDSSKSMSEN